jgi:type I restriction enzyme S subunit
MRWATVELGEVCVFLSGFAFKSDLFSAEPNGLPVIRIRDVLPGSSKTFYSGDYQSQYIVERGDILIGMDGEFNRERWKSDPALLNQRVCKAIARESLVDNGYLYHALPMLLKKIEDETPFVTVKHLSVAKLKSAQIPLPPLDEQRRIAAILDKCHESELLATKANSLYSSLFEASFHSFLRQVEDRESIPQVPLSSVCTRITKGTTPSSLGLPDADGDIPFVRVQDIDKNVLIAESVALQIPMETHHALSRSMLQSGDILVSIAGTIGRVCEVRSLPPHGANCNQAVAIAKPIPDVVRPLFLKCLLSDRPAQKQMRGAGVTGTITNLSLGQLGEIQIPVPSIEAQDKICDQLERLADIGERFQNSFVTAKRLSDSLTSFLMSGT